MKKTDTIRASNLIFRVSAPKEQTKSRVGLMLHGWTGDESSMWVFTNQLAEDWLLLSPQAPYSSQDTDRGGYSWIDKRDDHWPQFRDLLHAIHVLHTDLHELEKTFPTANFSNISVFGFSQGAAASFVYCMIHSKQVSKLGMLSGFIPDDSQGYISKPNPSDLNIFIGHGSQDRIVPLSKANEANQLLEQNGFSPQLCISDVGHRLGADCYEAFSTFMNRP